MTEGELRQLVEDAAELLRPQLERSPALRRTVTALGRWLIEQAAEAEGASDGRADAPDAITQPDASDPSPSSPDLPSLSDAAAPPDGHAPAPEVGWAPLQIGDARIDISIRGTADEIARARRAGAEPDGAAPPARADPVRAIDMALVETRCRLKAEACRLYAQRERATDPPARQELTQGIPDLIARAKALPSCFLWVLWREREQPPVEVIDQIGACYEALADAAGISMRALREPDADALPEALQLVAEASSALRLALEPTWLTSADSDQDDAHWWLRAQTQQREVFVPRHMKLDDPADPVAAPEVSARAARLAMRLDAAGERSKRVTSRLKRIRYHGGQVAGADEEDAAHHYQRIAEAVVELADLGVAPTDRRIAAAIDSDLAQGFPEQFAASGPIAAAIRHIVSEVASGEASEPASADSVAQPRWSERVLRVRAMLRDRAVVIIGGELRPAQAEAIRDAFALAEVEWPALSEHGSADPMRAPIARPRTALVIVIIRLAGHQHAEEARRCARAAGVPLVHLPAGFNPEQIAGAVLEQASQQLRQGAETR